MIWKNGFEFLRTKEPAGGLEDIRNPVRSAVSHQIAELTVAEVDHQRFQDLIIDKEHGTGKQWSPLSI